MSTSEESDKKDMERLSSSYKTFLSDSNAVDMADVFLAVCCQNCEFNESLNDCISGTNFLILNPRYRNPVEVSIRN